MTDKPKRQTVARIALFKSEESKPSAYHGVIEVQHDIKAGTALDVTLYKEVSRKGNGYLSGPLYIQPAKPKNDNDDVDFE